MATLARLGDALVDRLPLAFAAVFVLAVSLLAQLVLKRDPLSGVPIAGGDLGGEEKRRQRYLKDAKKIYMDAYNKFKDTVYKITTTADATVVVVPAKFLPELRNLPDDVVSFSQAIAETMASKYTNLQTDETVALHTIKTTLTPGLVRLNPILTDEVAQTVRSEIPPCKDWTEVNVNRKLLRIVAIVSGRIFLGPELCRDEEYIDAAINYTIELMAVRTAVLRMKPWKRPFLAWRLPEKRRLVERERKFSEILRPVIHARRLAEKNDPSYVKPDDMLQWIIDGQLKVGDKGDEHFAKIQLGLSFAAIHTTTLTATNAFYNLAAHPELQAILREECASILTDYGGVFTSPALHAMKKVDSFLKETLRFNPASYSSFERKVLKPFTLSNGQIIPAGVMIQASAYGVSRDPQPFPNPDEFDGLRFYKLREKAESFNMSEGGKSSAVDANAHNQFVSVSPNSLTFGYGRHACPGRFFAANEIKLIVARMLLQYEMKLSGDATERYPNLEFMANSVPDPNRTILLKEL